MIDSVFHTVVRHFLLFGLLFSWPIFTAGKESFYSWIARNFLFLLVWLCSVFLAGYGAYRLVPGKQLKQWFVKFLHAEDVKEMQLKLYKRFILKWSSCLQCVTYSSGGLLSFLYAFFHFHFPAFVAGLYFFFLGALLTSAIGMLLYLIDLVKEEKGRST